MEVPKCGLHVFAVGLLAITATYSDDVLYPSTLHGHNLNRTTVTSSSQTRNLRRVVQPSTSHILMQTTTRRKVTSANTSKQFTSKASTPKSTLSSIKVSLKDKTFTSTSSTLRKGSTRKIQYTTETGGDGYEENKTDDDDDGLLVVTPESPENDPYAMKTIPFQKCCAKSESFDAGLKCVKRQKGLKGIDVAKDDLVGQKYPWFPTLIISGSKVVELAPTNTLNVTRIRVKYASMPKCDDTERLILQWYKSEQSFFFIFASNGTIVELNHRSMETIAMWPVDAYCMDSVPSNEYSYYVALLCPCLHKICARKCCPRGFYYNMTYNSCNEFKNLIPDYKPTFYRGRTPLRDSISSYVLRRMPLCDGRKMETLYNPNGSLYIQKNGSLLIHQENGEWNIVNNSRYCADYFVNESLKEKVMNVLFCIKQSDRYLQTLFQLRRIQRRSDGDFFSVNFFLFLAVLAFVVIYE